MPTPAANWTTVELRWNFKNIDGTSPIGYIEALPYVRRFSVTSASGLEVLVIRPITAKIINGLVSMTVPATDDPDVTPNGFTYLITEYIAGTSDTSYHIEVPQSAAGTGIDVSLIAPVSSTVGLPLSLVTRAQFDDLKSRVESIEAGGGGGGGSSAVASVNGDIGIVVLNQDDVLNGINFKQYSLTDKNKLAAIANNATSNLPNASLLARINHTGTQVAATISDFSITVNGLIADEHAANPDPPSVHSVNGDPGGITGDVTLSLDSLADVSVSQPSFDEDGVYIPGTGPAEADVPQWDPVTLSWVSGQVTGFAPEGWVAPYTLRGISISAGDTIPADLPDDSIIFDETKPTTPLIELVNTVTVSGSSLTLPSPLTATINDVTLTANCAITFPTPIAGARFRLALRQDATGSRVPTWPSSPRWNSSTNTAPTLSTTAGIENVLDFASIGGSNWRQIGLLMTYGASLQPGPTPGVRGNFGADSGASNSNASVQTTLPSAIVSGDILYMVVTTSGTSGQFLTLPTINGTPIPGTDIKDGTSTTGFVGSSQTFWLIRHVMAGTESSTTITSGVMTANVRPSMTGVVVKDGVTTGEVLVMSTKSAVSTSLVIPSITPSVANSLLVHIAGFRSSGSATPQAIGPGSIGATSWTERREHYEARLDGTNVNYGGYAETFPLTGNAGVTKTSTNGTYAVQAQERSYVIAVPPPLV